MRTSEDLQQFLCDYQTYVSHTLKPARERVQAYLERWRTPEYWGRFARAGSSAFPSPIRSVLIRIKRPERVVDKIIQRADDFPDGLNPKSFRCMNDALGVRIIVYFLSQLPYIDREIRQCNEIEISSDHPPEAYGNPESINRFGLAHIGQKEKESGYASIHYILRLRPRSGSPLENSPWFEMQVRTLAQELWSEMEHILAYKPQGRADYLMRKRLQILSREIGAIDEHFNLLNEELVQKQTAFNHQPEDQLTTENLPSTLNEIGLRCAQQDIHTILNLLFSRGIRSVGSLVQIGSPRRIEIIKHTYIAVLGRPPDNFEIIATLGALNDVPSGFDERKYIISHIEYGRFWNTIRDDKQIGMTNSFYPNRASSVLSHQDNSSCSGTKDT